MIRELTGLANRRNYLSNIARCGINKQYIRSLDDAIRSILWADCVVYFLTKKDYMAYEEIAPMMIPVEQANRLTDEFEPTISGMLVKLAAAAEIEQLQSVGIDASLLDVAPTHSLPTKTQLQVDAQSHALGQLGKTEAFTTLFDGRVHSAGAKWAKLSKRAIALWALKQSGNDLPHEIAPDIDPAVYDETLFDGKSAHDVLVAKHPKSAAEVTERYRVITTSLLEDDPYTGEERDSDYLRFIDKHGFAYLDSREFLAGVLDSRAVDTRALAASQLALQHVLASPELADRPLVTASLACGAAAPMFELNQLFADNNLKVERNILVDNDPMALASAVALGRAYDMSEKVDVRLEDIVGQELTNYIEPHSVDIVDILGIVDYLPTSVLGYRAAENFIGKIANIMSPGGIIVAGNALKSRPHQAFFERVWPTLQQRDPIEMVGIIEKAGYQREDIKVRIPQREGVYGVYGITVPESGLPEYRESRLQLAAKKMLTVASKFNKY